MPVAESWACHLNLYRNANFSTLNPIADLLKETGCERSITDQQTHALPKTAEIARG